MSYFPLRNTAIENQINDLREQGKSNQEVYHELVKQNSDAESIAKLIVATPTRKNKSRYATLNYLLILVLICSVFVKASYLVLVLQTIPFNELLMMLLPLICNVLFIIGIYRYQAAHYSLCCIFSVIGMFLSMRLITMLVSKTVSILNLSDTGFSLILAIFSFFLGRLLFPEFGFGKIPVDGNGVHILK